MINGNASEFIDKMYYEDHYVIFNNEKYFVYDCFFTSIPSVLKIRKGRYVFYSYLPQNDCFYWGF